MDSVCSTPALDAQAPQLLEEKVSGPRERGVGRERNPALLSTQPPVRGGQAWGRELLGEEALGEVSFLGFTIRRPLIQPQNPKKWLAEPVKTESVQARGQAAPLDCSSNAPPQPLKLGLSGSSKPQIQNPRKVFPEKDLSGQRLPLLS